MIDVEAYVADARAAYGHVDGITDVECLVRRIMQLERFRDERLELMRLNVWQAQELSRRAV